VLKIAGVAMGALLAARVASHAEVSGSVRYSFGEYQSAAQNRYLSARYDWLLRVDPGFRAYRMGKECDPIGIGYLHSHCMASFDEYEPILWR
jgi:hypothetical protein